MKTKKLITNNCRLSAYVEPNIAMLIAKKAEQHGISVSEYIKRLIYKELDK